MNIHQREHEGVVILDIDGKSIAGADSELFQAKIQRLLDEDKKQVLVNLQQVNWINSTGIGILISGYSVLDKQGGKLKLVHVSERIHNVLKITRLDTIFEYYETEDEAVRSFTQPQ
jgi:anti-sigma B factor antagonist